MAKRRVSSHSARNPGKRVEGGERCSFDDLWSMDAGTGTWELLPASGAAVSGRQGHSLLTFGEKLVTHPTHPRVRIRSEDSFPTARAMAQSRRACGFPGTVWRWRRAGEPHERPVLLRPAEPAVDEGPLRRKCNGHVVSGRCNRPRACSAPAEAVGPLTGSCCRTLYRTYVVSR